MKQKAYYEENQDFSGYTSDIKPIALYLPQYHEIPENNAWWGEGFTEWTNVKKATPKFPGHYQPRVPHESIGYYDLTDISVLEKQAALAKAHGIYAFGVYHYWFSGKRLLEKPMDLLLENPQVDFPFFLIWANENWSRRWDGKEADILMGQDYSDDDPRKFIEDIKKYTDDPRYMRVDGKPVIGIYNPVEVPKAAQVLKNWREEAQKQGIGEILIWSCVTDSDARDAGVVEQIDAEYEFPPRGKGYVSHTVDKNDGVLWDYHELVDFAKDFELESSHPIYRGTMVSWDNSARKQRGYHAWKGYTPALFYRWNRIAVNYTRKNFPADKRFLFINAWNEWGEGTYLEPDQEYGFAAINALSKAIYDMPFDEKTPLLLGGGVARTPGWDKELDSQPRIAVQLHLFYLDLIDEIFARLTSIQHPFDLYVTTNTPYKAEFFKQKFAQARVLHHTVRNLQVDVCDNQGRDVMPFLNQLRPVFEKYKYFCHIHSKKSKHTNEGNLWRKFLYDTLLGEQTVTDDILCLLETDPKVGIVCPRPFEEMAVFLEWGSNKENVCSLAQKLGIQIDTEEKLIFPAGDMFWAKTEAVRQLLAYPFTAEEIPPEAGQLDGTIMHAIERLWSFVAKHNGFATVFVENAFPGQGDETDTSARAELSRMKGKGLYRLAGKVYALADKLLPKGSRRRELVKKLLRPFKR